MFSGQSEVCVPRTLCVRMKVISELFHMNATLLIGRVKQFCNQPKYVEKVMVRKAKKVRLVTCEFPSV